MWCEHHERHALSGNSTSRTVATRWFILKLCYVIITCAPQKDLVKCRWKQSKYMRVASPSHSSSKTTSLCANLLIRSWLAKNCITPYTIAAWMVRQWWGWRRSSTTKNMKNKKTKNKWNKSRQLHSSGNDDSVWSSTKSQKKTTNLIFRRGVKLIAVHRPIRTCVRIGRRGRGQCVCVRRLKRSSDICVDGNRMKKKKVKEIIYLVKHKHRKFMVLLVVVAACRWCDSMFLF